MACDSVPARGPDGERQRPDLYLRTRHALRHVYRLARPHGRRVADFNALLSIEPRLDRMFPPPAALFRDYVGVFSWAMAAYRLAGFSGRTSFFWAAEEPEIARSWQPVVRQKPAATIEQHTVPGDHMTTVSVGLPGLARSIADCTMPRTSWSIAAAVSSA